MHHIECALGMTLLKGWIAAADVRGKEIDWVRYKEGNGAWATVTREHILFRLLDCKRPTQIRTVRLEDGCLVPDELVVPDVVEAKVFVTTHPNRTARDFLGPFPPQASLPFESSVGHDDSMELEHSTRFIEILAQPNVVYRSGRARPNPYGRTPRAGRERARCTEDRGRLCCQVVLQLATAGWDRVAIPHDRRRQRVRVHAPECGGILASPMGHVATRIWVQSPGRRAARAGCCIARNTAAGREAGRLVFFAEKQEKRPFRLRERRTMVAP